MRNKNREAIQISQRRFQTCPSILKSLILATLRLVNPQTITVNYALPNTQLRQLPPISSSTTRPHLTINHFVTITMPWYTTAPSARRRITQEHEQLNHSALQRTGHIKTEVCPHQALPPPTTTTKVLHKVQFSSSSHTLPSPGNIAQPKDLLRNQ
jgi:hypothetical protein